MKLVSKLAVQIRRARGCYVEISSISSICHDKLIEQLSHLYLT